MSNEQIAREASIKTRPIGYDWDYLERLSVEGVILAAIEKATTVLTSCRDHWKTSFNHEREKVIRLSNQIHAIHGGKCICSICELVRLHSKPAAQPQRSEQADTALSNRDYIAKNLHKINPETDFDEKGNLIRREPQRSEPREWYIELPLDGSIGQVFTDPKQLTKGGKLIRVREIAAQPQCDDPQIKTGILAGGEYIPASKLEQQPPATEQEWTVDWVIMQGVDNYADAKRLVDAHKAALADAKMLGYQIRKGEILDLKQQLAVERQKSVDVLRERTLEFAEQSGNQIKQIKELKQQLSAEREATKRADTRLTELMIEAAKQEQQLLQAQAAIAELLAHRDNVSIDAPIAHIEPEIKALRSLDQSILDAHDEEVRKPLVDALELVQLMFQRSDASDNFLGDDEQEAWTAVNNALAKVKGEKQ